MTSYFTKLYLSKCNVSRVVSINKIFYFNCPSFSTLVILAFTKISALKIVHALKIYQHKKFRSPTLPRANFTTTSEV
jgi:hypothetical protein